MTSLAQAIDTKYGDKSNEEVEQDTSEYPDFVIFVRVQSRKYIPSALVLDKCNINSAGDENFLKEKCGQRVTELDLSYNTITDWNEIIKILKLLPAIQFLNLSFNQLDSSYCTTVAGEAGLHLLPNLTSLILIGTNVAWATVWIILEKTPNLAELHLSKNKFKSVDLDQIPSGEQAQFPSIKRLIFTANLLTCWSEVAKLGQVLPSLEHLGLSDCQIDAIPENAHNNFQKLQSISLTNNPLTKLEDVSNLNKFPCLTELRIQGTQLFSDLTDHERRKFVIALLPNVATVNGGSKIPQSEREAADRAFIRYFDEREVDVKPPRYYELKEIHGELFPLLNLDLTPPTQVKVQIIFEEIKLETEISVYQTTSELKVFLEPLIGIEPSRQRLFYVDPGLKAVVGDEEMKFPLKKLYSYNMMDGDEIHIRLK